MGPQVSRAQLLLALHQRQVSALTLEHTAEAWWGFEAQEATETSSPDQTVTLGFPEQVLDKISDPPKQGLPPPRNPLQMPEAWVAWWMGSERGDDNAPKDAQLEALSAEELNPPDEPLVSYQDLVPLPRLLPALQKQVRVSASGGLDVKRLLSASAKRQWPARLPRTQRPNWPQHLLLVVDYRVELYPYRNDFFRLASALKALVPASQISIYVGEGGPDGHWEPWSVQQAAERKVIEGLPRQPGASYLILSDLGLLCPKSGLHQQWLHYLQALPGGGQSNGSRFALAPVEAHQVPQALAEVVQVLRWSPNSRFQPERGTHEQIGQGEHARDEALALEQLLACVGAVLRMDPPLLRAMRQASHWPGHAGLEGQVWANAQVSGTTYACWKGDMSQGQQRSLEPAMAEVLSQANRTHHAHWTLGMRVVDNMRLLSANPSGDEALLASTRRAITQLTMASQPGAAVGADARHTASYVLARVPEQARAMLGDVLNDLAESLGSVRAARVSWSLVQRGESLAVVEAARAHDRPGVVLSERFAFAAPREPLLISSPIQGKTLVCLPEGGELRLQSMAPGTEILVGGKRVRIQKAARSHCAAAWEQTDRGLFYAVQSLNGVVSMIAHGAETGWARSHKSSGSVMERYGVDRAGAYLDLAFPFPSPGIDQLQLIESVQIVQRLRYLPPATFLMGSLEGEGASDEHPQHPVTLTQGLWLAETPCTQSLWQAVMGRNPSHFSEGPDAPQRPVENVSWDDVQQFLAKLNALLPEGCEAVLPTEAQWECACRAGTTTAYWWGNHPDSSKLNWFGQYNGTTPVDRYPPNPWGMRDMHANVREWCADHELRTYEQRTTCDPIADTGGDARVVRGGSWFSHPGDARSGYRHGRHRGERNHSLGFRFALRSSSPQGAEPQPGGLKAADGQEEGGAAGGRNGSAGASAEATRARPKKKGIA